MIEKQTVKFGDICREVKLTSKDPIADGYECYIGLEHLDSGSLKIKRWGMFAEDNPSFTRVFKKGHILFGKRRPYLKKAAIAEFDGICSGDIIVMEPVCDGAVITDLLPFIVQSNIFWGHAIRTSSGSLSPRTKFSALKDFVLELPNKEKQIGLENVFRKTLFLIQHYQGSIESLNTLKMSISDRFREVGNEVVLIDLLEFITSGSRGWAKFYSDQGSLFIRITNMDRGSLHVDLEDKKFVNLPIDSIEGTRTKVCEGDILISITADLGIVSFIDKYFPFEGYVSQHIALCRANVEKVTPKYLAYLLASPYGQKKLASLNDGGAKAGISLKNLQKLKLSIHSQCEQLEIVKTLECIDKQNKLLDKSLIKTRSMFNVIVDASL